MLLCHSTEALLLKNKTIYKWTFLASKLFLTPEITIISYKHIVKYEKVFIVQCTILDGLSLKSRLTGFLELAGIRWEIFENAEIGHKTIYRHMASNVCIFKFLSIGASLLHITCLLFWFVPSHSFSLYLKLGDCGLSKAQLNKPQLPSYFERERLWFCTNQKCKLSTVHKGANTHICSFS